MGVSSRLFDGRGSRGDQALDASRFMTGEAEKPSSAEASESRR